MIRLHLLMLALGCGIVCGQPPAAATTPANPYAAWQKGPARDPGFFFIGVWLQDPARAKPYAAAGINSYVGLWQGPTEAQLTGLKEAGMKVICDQNEVGLRHLDDPTIIGWMHGDEPDNAQSLGEGKGYGPPVPPAKIIADYREISRRDPSRPVLLNLGQGVAWDDWVGRGVRTRHPEDYPEYVKGCDIASFDIYPVAHPNPAVAGKLEFVARGVKRLVEWAGPGKPVWNCIECTRIGGKTAKATPAQVRGEVWMSIIHGSMGLIWFVHEWQPKFDEAALLHDPEMLRAVTTINRQVTTLAPVLNTPTIRTGATVSSGNPQVPVACMLKRHGGSLYLFAAAMGNAETAATIKIPGIEGTATVKVVGEDREITSRDGSFADRFRPHDVHIYQIN